MRARTSGSLLDAERGLSVDHADDAAALRGLRDQHSTGFDVAQKIRQTSGTCLSALSTFTGKPSRRVNNQTGYSNPNRTFVVAYPGCYLKYRLVVTADNYNDPTYPITLVSIATLQLYGN